MLVPPPGQGPPSLGPGGANMYAPSGAGMQMMQQQVPMGGAGQNPGGQGSGYNSFSLLAERGGVHYIDYPPVNSVIPSPNNIPVLMQQQQARMFNSTHSTQ